VGKTSLSLGLVRALARRGKRVQTFKVGPDFLDPTYLALASGRPCYNLDGWMMGQPYVRELFSRATRDADVAIIEGVMGLFDGASASSLEGSTAEIAIWLDVPVLLVINAHGLSRSAAAMVKGYAEFEPALRLAGVIANQSGTERHKVWIAESLRAAGLAPLLGAVPRGALPALSSRHLGLVTADPAALPGETLDQLADACERFLNLDELVGLAKSAGDGESGAEAPASPASTTSPARRVRIGVARDEVFHFYYPDNLEMLRLCGAELVEFSPLRDSALPGDLDGLYLGGGYPELQAESLSQNGGMLAAVRGFAESGRCIYAECGGLMYLGRGLTDCDGRRHALCGILPIETAMLKKRAALGYVEARPDCDSVWGAGGAREALRLRGHEFHYSNVGIDDSAAAGWRPAYSVRRRGREALDAEGFCKGSILASYIHVHFASCPEAAGLFVNRCGGIR
jgi:cobyrinic acid a,c-diamide synthase